MAETTFSLEYILSLIIALSAYYFINSVAPDSMVWLKIFIYLQERNYIALDYQNMGKLIILILLEKQI